MPIDCNRARSPPAEFIFSYIYIFIVLSSFDFGFIISFSSFDFGFIISSSNFYLRIFGSDLGAIISSYSFYFLIFDDLATPFRPLDVERETQQDREHPRQW